MPILEGQMAANYPRTVISTVKLFCEEENNICQQSVNNELG
jgi:hypothetical protein